MCRYLFSFCLMLVFSSCITIDGKEEKSTKDTDTLAFTPWYFQDLALDSVPGISLTRVYDSVLNHNVKSPKPIIVAILDTQVDIDHEDLKETVYINSDEIPDNDIDDDENGYIDDVNGWNFLGYAENESVYYGSPDHMRIIKRLQSKYNGNQKIKDSAEFDAYQFALKLQEKDIAYADKRINYGERLWKAYKDSKATFSKNFSGTTLTKQLLDSIVATTEEEKFLLNYLGNVERLNLSPEDMFAIQKDALHRKLTMNNIHYNDRALIGDDPYDYTDIDYGTPNVYGQSKLFKHGTQVAGVIAADRTNTFGTSGISDNIRLMICAISPLGDELDKDIYNAVRYAVDNGAKIINFSSGKDICDNEELLLKALRYAEENDVLIITSAGNSGKDTDLPENKYYPIDHSEKKEIISNLLTVGASSNNLDHTIYSIFSNYGKSSVDVFAPGQDIKTTHADGLKYITLDGTSISCAITSGVAALIRSHYPTLTATQVKQILMESSVTYDIMVNVPTEENPQRQLPFSELSKSGGIVNAYNALLMAENVAKGKKKL